MVSLRVHPRARRPRSAPVGGSNKSTAGCFRGGTHSCSRRISSGTAVADFRSCWSGVRTTVKVFAIAFLGRPTAVRNRQHGALS